MREAQMEELQAAIRKGDVDTTMGMIQILLEEQKVLFVQGIKFVHGAIHNAGFPEDKENIMCGLMKTLENDFEAIPVMQVGPSLTLPHD